MKKIVLSLFLFTIPALGQLNLPNEQNSPTNCELSKRIMGTVHELTTDSKLIVVARLGTGEFRDSLNQKRLSSVANFLQNSFKRERKSSVFARGEPANGLGRLEFYVNNKLYYQILIKSKKNILTECYSE